MNLQTKRLTLSGVLFQELATSRRPLQRWNDPSGQLLQLFDTEQQILYVTPRSELFNGLISRDEPGGTPSEPAGACRD